MEPCTLHRFSYWLQAYSAKLLPQRHRATEKNQETSMTPCLSGLAFFGKIGRPWLGGGPLAARQQGVTLLETIVALGILGLIGVAYVSAVATASKSTGVLDQGVQAAALARSQLEGIERAPYNTDPLCYPACYAASVSPPAGYTISVSSSKVVDSVLGALCGVLQDDCLQRVTVTVSRDNSVALSLGTYKKR